MLYRSDLWTNAKKKKKNIDFDFDNENSITLSKCLMTRVANITMMKQY